MQVSKNWQVLRALGVAFGVIVGCFLPRAAIYRWYWRACDPERGYTSPSFSFKR